MKHPRASYCQHHFTLCRVKFFTTCSFAGQQVLPQFLPAKEKHPRSMMEPQPCFMVGTLCSGHYVFCFACRPKSSILVSSDQSTFIHMSVINYGFKLDSWHFAIVGQRPVDRFSHLSCGSLQLLQS
ncbi:hypothetical protein GOODEAATRI_012810 [Goodea atripinnis]|uniref:Uncharacterized protein n=1 Tax=Goodea atripinnis TaxID=208336 RepID=A0ABV0MT06_9TELE